jgi:hypothetical protein
MLARRDPAHSERPQVPVRCLMRRGGRSQAETPRGTGIFVGGVPDFGNTVDPYANRRAAPPRRSNTVPTRLPRPSLRRSLSCRVGFHVKRPRRTRARGGLDPQSASGASRTIARRLRILRPAAEDGPGLSHGGTQRSPDPQPSPRPSQAARRPRRARFEPAAAGSIALPGQMEEPGHARRNTERMGGGGALRYHDRSRPPRSRRLGRSRRLAWANDEWCRAGRFTARRMDLRVVPVLPQRPRPMTASTDVPSAARVYRPTPRWTSPAGPTAPECRVSLAN